VASSSAFDTLAVTLTSEWSGARGRETPTVTARLAVDGGVVADVCTSTTSARRPSAPRWCSRSAPTVPFVAKFAVSQATGTVAASWSSSTRPPPKSSPWAAVFQVKGPIESSGEPPGRPQKGSKPGQATTRHRKGWPPVIPSWAGVAPSMSTLLPKSPVSTSDGLTRLT
jgi:hypothetical protein